MNNRRDDHDDHPLWKVVLCIGLVIAFISLVVVQCAHADSVIEADNGWNIEVPEGWSVSIAPEGYNFNPYHKKNNPKGVLPGWGGWPHYDEYLRSINCAPGELVVSPSICPPQPKFVKPYSQCYFEPVEEKEVEEERCLVISPATECED